MEIEHDHKAWVMWHGVALQRMKKMPPLKDYMAGNKPVQGIDENAIMARLRAYQKRVENGER